MVIPNEMSLYSDKYISWYKTKFSNRVLSWVHSSSRSTVMFNTNSGVKELEASLYQALILLLFNQDESLTFSELVVVLFNHKNV